MSENTKDTPAPQFRWQSLHQRSSANALYHPGERKLLIRVCKFVDAKDIQLPPDVDVMVEDALGRESLKYPYQVSVRVGGLTWMKADRDALREAFPEIAPIPRASTYRER